MQPKVAVTRRRVEIQLGLIFLDYINTSTYVENKNISTWAEIKKTISSIFISHDL